MVRVVLFYVDFLHYCFYYHIEDLLIVFMKTCFFVVEFVQYYF